MSDVTATKAKTDTKAKTATKTATKAPPATPMAAPDRLGAVPAAERLAEALGRGDHVRLVNAPDGYDALALAALAKRLAQQEGERSVTLLHLSRDGQRCQRLADALAFVAPQIETLVLPAW